MDYSISAAALALLKVLGHPSRLRILKALERRGVLSAPQLAIELQEDYDRVYFSLEKLAAVGAVEVVHTEPSRTGSPIRYFRATRRGWAEFGELLERLAGG
jgi:predicted ArsR family transcriptional regulator